MSTVYIGLDPGKNGGLSYIEVDGTTARSGQMKMPESEDEILRWMKQISTSCVTYAALERLWGYSGNKKAGGNGPAQFKLGDNHGFLRACLMCMDIPFHHVTPQSWQKEFRIPKRDISGGETQPQFKKRLQAVASSLFPYEKVTLKTADSLLLAEYCRRMCTRTNKVKKGK